VTQTNELMPQVLAVLKDMSAYLSKADTTQEKARISKPPKTGEGQKPIIGGRNGDNAPGDGITQKEFVAIPKSSPIAGTTNPDDGKESTLLKEDEEYEQNVEEETEETPEEQVEEEETGEELPQEDVEEIKSLLKSMVAMLAKSQKTQTVDPAYIRKCVKAETDVMLRKMGFHPSVPDVVKLPGSRMGIDQTADVKKSEDSIGSIVSNVSKEQKQALGIVEDLSKKSWREINAMREQTGGFNAFGK